MPTTLSPLKATRLPMNLMERIAQEGWNPEISEGDKASKDALAARGLLPSLQRS
jgi:hypothetical protein